MSYPYNDAFAIPFPVVPVVIHQIDGSASTPSVSALLDTGADITVVPSSYLRDVQAEEAYTARIRGHWGDSWPVSVCFVDLEVAGQRLPAVDVVGDDESREVLLGRNALNKLVVLLDGPSMASDVLTSARAGQDESVNR